MLEISIEIDPANRTVTLWSPSGTDRQTAPFAGELGVALGLDETPGAQGVRTVASPCFCASSNVRVFLVGV